MTLLGSAAQYLYMRKVEAVVVAWHKTGNTWLSAMLRHAIQNSFKKNSKEMNRYFVSDYTRRDFWKIRSHSKVYHTHALPNPYVPELDDVAPIIREFDDKRMVVLIRDFRDLIVSSYMHEVFRATKPRFEGTVDQYARSDVFGVERIASYYREIAAVRRKQGGQTRVITYEELQMDTVGYLSALWEYCGYGKNEEAIKFAVASCNVDNMRKMEDQASNSSFLIPGLFVPQNSGENARKVREGKVGGWSKHLSPDSGEWIEPLYLSVLEELQRDFGSFNVIETR